MSTDYKFQGWMGLDQSSAKGNMVWQEYEPKPFEETDVDIRITHCGVCGTDIHVLRSGWAATNYPCVVGHEIVGVAARVGSKVKDIKVGDRVGAGTQAGACLNQKGDCEACADGLTPHCESGVGTYDSKWPDGSKTYGGYSDYWRGSGAFVYKIPDAIPSETAAPMLCGGITVFSPMLRYKVGPGKKVGIIGIGGLGHFGILSAKVLGSTEITAISRTSAKKQDALDMGATKFVATDEDPDWAKKNAGTLDLIVSTVSSPKMPIEDYLGLLRLKGHMVQVGAPEDKIPGFSMFSLIFKRCSLGGSLTGGPEEIKEMLRLFAEKGVRSWTNAVPMKDANKAIVDMEDGKARYRYVLVNEKHLD